MPEPFTKPSKTKRIVRLLKAIFLTRIPMNLLLLGIVMLLSVVGFQYFTSNSTGDTPTGNVILEQECPECVCEGAELGAECEPDCDLCPVKTKVETQNVIYYECPGGTLVKDLDECESNLPEVPEEYSGTVEGVTLIINNIEYEQDEEDSGFVTRVDYTIINKGDISIVPKIEVKVYEEWTLNVKKSIANKVLFPEVAINPNDYITRKDRVRIYFKGEEQTVRLLLVNRLPKIESEVLAVTRDIDLDYDD